MTKFLHRFLTPENILTLFDLCWATRLETQRHWKTAPSPNQRKCHVRLTRDARRTNSTHHPKTSLVNILASLGYLMTLRTNLIPEPAPARELHARELSQLAGSCVKSSQVGGEPCPVRSRPLRNTRRGPSCDSGHATNGLQWRGGGNLKPPFASVAELRSYRYLMNFIMGTRIQDSLGFVEIV